MVHINRFNHISWMAVVTPIDSPKAKLCYQSCGGVFVLSIFVVEFSVGIEAFVIGLSRISFLVLIKLKQDFLHIYCFVHGRWLMYPLAYMAFAVSSSRIE